MQSRGRAEAGRGEPGVEPRRVRAVYTGGVLKPLEPLDLPEGVEVLVTVEPARGGGGGVEGVEGPAAAEALEASGLQELAESYGEELVRALDEIIGHAAAQLSERIKEDDRLLDLYRAAERLEPGRAAERIGPPPLDSDTWLLILSDFLTVVEKAGFFDETRPLRVAANQRMLNPYDYVLLALRGRLEELDRLAERLDADPRMVRLVFLAMAEAVRRAVAQAVAGRG